MESMEMKLETHNDDCGEGEKPVQELEVSATGGSAKLQILSEFSETDASVIEVDDEDQPAGLQGAPVHVCDLGTEQEAVDKVEGMEITDDITNNKPLAAKELVMTRTWNVSFNREILEHLCSVCPAEYVANFRYVCKEWNEAALKSWRNGATLAVVDYQSGKSDKVELRRKLLNLRDLIGYIEDPEDPFKLNQVKSYQYQKYRLDGWYITNKNQNMTVFWNYFGSSIRYLELSNLRLAEMDILLKILYGKVPNMHTLVLEKLFVKTNESGVNDKENEMLASIPSQERLKVLKIRNLIAFPVDWMEFLKHFPNIEIFDSFNVKHDDDLRLILTAMMTIRIDVGRHVLQLKSLAIRRCDNHHHCVQRGFSETLTETLRDCEFPLEELHIKLGCKTNPKTAIAILEIFADSLKRLIFHVDFRCKYEYHTFPYTVTFFKLEELELYQWCPPGVRLHFLFGRIPNLKVLKVKGNFFKRQGKKKNDSNFIDISITTKMRTRLNVQRSLEEFSFIAFKLLIDKFNHLTTMAPKLTKLELNVDDAIFRAVCKKYPNLIELRVYGQGLTDEGITGLGEHNTENSDASAVVQGKAASISDLERLRVFVMHNRNHALTDKSVFHGFLVLPSLYTLEICLPEGQISQNARLALEKNIQNLVQLKMQPVKQSSDDRKPGLNDDGNNNE